MNMKCGAIFSDYDCRDYKLVYTAKSSDFPKRFSLKMRDIKNQGAVGSCVAHALSSIIEYYNYKQLHNRDRMSVGYIYGNRTTSDHKDDGMVIRDALDAVRQYGDVENNLFPYNSEVPRVIDLFESQKDELFDKGYPYRISQYCRVSDVNSIKSALMAGNPILIGMVWYTDMKVVDGILTTNYEGDNGGHAMVIYGWDENGWKVHNSWGESWGDNGRATVPYDMAIEEMWIVTDDIIENTKVKKPFSSTIIGKFLAKIINKIVNIFKK